MTASVNSVAARSWASEASSSWRTRAWKRRSMPTWRQARPPTSAVESDTKHQPLSVCSEARCSRSRATASTMRSLKATQSADTSR